MKTFLTGFGAIAFLGFSLILLGGIDQATKDALKVGHLLKTIERQPPRSDSQELNAEVSEKELNAYIAYRLAQEKNSLIDRLTVDLLDGNHVGGRLRFDAQRLNVGEIMGAELDFDFKGIFHTRNGAARLDLISLQLNGQPVKPQVLDFLMGTAALVYGMDSGSINDWYELPKGIKRIRINKAVAVLYY